MVLRVGGGGGEGGGRTFGLPSGLIFFLLLDVEFLLRGVAVLICSTGTDSIKLIEEFTETMGPACTSWNCSALASVRASLNGIVPFKDSYDENLTGGDRNNMCSG